MSRRVVRAVSAVVSSLKQSSPFSKLRRTPSRIESLEGRQYFSDSVWIDDGVPANAGGYGNYENYAWVSSNPAPHSGTASLKADGTGGGYNLYNIFPPRKLGAGDKIVAYAYIDPAAAPSELMLMFTSNSDSNHRAYFGNDDIGFGTNNTPSRQRIGDVPTTAGWNRLEIPAEAVGLQDQYINGVQLWHSGGSIAWDSIGIDALNVTAGPMTVNANPPSQSFTFDESPAAAPTTADLTLENLSSNTTIDRSVLSTTYNSATKTGTLTWPGVNGGTGGGGKLTDGNYELTLSSTALATSGGKHLGGDTSTDTYWLDADFNRDRSVDTIDYATFFANNGGTNKTFAQGDANLDGTVDSADYAILSSAYGRSLAAPPTIANYLKVTNQHTNSLDLYWQQGGDTPDGWHIYRSTDGTNFTQIDQVAARDYNMTYLDDTLKDGTKYWYRVRPYTVANGNGLSFTKAWGVTQLPTATSVSVKDISDSALDITFTDNSTNDTGYGIWISANGGPYTLLTTVPGSTSPTGTGPVTYPIGGLDPDTDYKIEVRPISPVQEAARSEPVSFQTASAMNEPQGVWSGPYFPNWTWNSPSASSSGGPQASFQSEISTLTISGLLRHTWARLYVQLSTVVPISADQPTWPTVEFNKIPVLPSMIGSYHPDDSHTAYEVRYAIDGNSAFRHRAPSITATFDARQSDTVWTSYGGYLETHLPIINSDLGGTQMIEGETPNPAVAQPMTFHVSRRPTGSAAIDSTPFTVHISKTGTAKSGEDYTGIPDDFTFEPGEFERNLVVSVVDDDKIEDARETVTLCLAPLAEDGAKNDGAAETEGIGDDDFKVIGLAVSYSSIGVLKDSGLAYSADYSNMASWLSTPPQWLDDDLDGKDDRRFKVAGDSSGMGDFGVPVANTANAAGGTGRLSAYVYFHVDGNPRPGRLTIKGEGAGPGVSTLDSDEETTYIDPSIPLDSFDPLLRHHVVRAAVSSSQLLPDKISYGEMTVSWDIEKASGEVVAGKSSTNMGMVTTSNAVQPFETVLMLACRGANGLTPGSAAIPDAVFAEFKDLSTARADGNVITYWGSHSGISEAGMTDDDVLSVARLLKYADGRCGAWSNFLADCLEVAGIKSDIVTLNLKRSTLTFLNDEPVPVGYQPSGPAMEVKKRSQGGKISWQYFQDHGIVKLRGTNHFFDPSYGTSFEGANAIPAWEAQSVTGFVNIFQPLGATFEPGLWWMSNPSDVENVIVSRTWMAYP